MDPNEKKGIARVVVEKNGMRLEFEVPDVSVSELAAITKEAKAAVHGKSVSKDHSAS